MALNSGIKLGNQSSRQSCCKMLQQRGQMFLRRRGNQIH